MKLHTFSYWMDALTGHLTLEQLEGKKAEPMPSRNNRGTGRTYFRQTALHIARQNEALQLAQGGKK